MCIAHQATAKDTVLSGDRFALHGVPGGLGLHIFDRSIGPPKERSPPAWSTETCKANSPSNFPENTAPPRVDRQKGA